MKDLHELPRTNEAMCISHSDIFQWITKRRTMYMILILLAVSISVIGVIYGHLQTSAFSCSFASVRLHRLLQADRGRVTYRNAYDWSVGGNEIRQYRRFMETNPDFKFTIVTETTSLEFDPNYDYDVKHVDIDGTAGNGVSVSIEERYRKTKTSGGSCFYVYSETASSAIRQMCSFWDHFDGTYIVWCPAMGVERCMNISIALEHTNFTAYSSCRHPLHRTIWRDLVCERKTSGFGNFLASQPPTPEVDGLPKRPVLWERTTDNRFALRTQAHKTFQTMNQSTLCECVKQFRKILMIGASHMRFKADYLVFKCYQLPEGLRSTHRDLSIENVHYIAKDHASHFQGLLLDTLTRDKLNKNDLVILQTGAHDMAKIGLQALLTIFMDRYGKFVAQLKRLSDEIGFRLIVVTSPPVADDKQQYRRGSRNSCTLSALVHQLHETLAPTGVDIFDEFSVILPWQRRAACVGHYICFNIHKKAPPTLKGDVGEQALLLLMDRACRQTR